MWWLNVWVMLVLACQPAIPTPARIIFGMLSFYSLIRVLGWLRRG